MGPKGCRIELNTLKIFIISLLKTAYKELILTKFELITRLPTKYKIFGHSSSFYFSVNFD